MTQHGSTSANSHTGYNRVSLKRHDAHVKREPWDYRKPRRKRVKQRERIIRYVRVGKKWVRA